jgi:hypothetical protein
MEFKGTKGKWELADRGRRVECLVKPQTYKFIASSCNNTKWQYDMLLISKAPEMLEFLNELSNAPKDLNPIYWIEKAKQLIKESTEL